MVRRRWSSDLGEVLVAECEFSRIGKVGWDVRLDELLSNRGCLSREPGTVAMVRVPGRGIGRPRHNHSISSREGAEVIVESMVLLDDNYDTVDLARTQAACRLLCRNHLEA